MGIDNAVVKKKDKKICFSRGEFVAWIFLMSTSGFIFATFGGGINQRMVQQLPKWGFLLRDEHEEIVVIGQEMVPPTEKSVHPKVLNTSQLLG